MDAKPDKPFLQIVVCAAGVATDVGKLITAAQERHWDVGVVVTARTRLPRRRGGRGADRSPRPLSLANPGPTPPDPPRRRDRRRPGQLQHRQQMGRRDLRQPRPGHPVRSTCHGRTSRLTAVPELGPGRAPRVPAEPGTAARDGRSDRLVRPAQAQSRWRGRTLPLGGSAGTSHSPAVPTGVTPGRGGEHQGTLRVSAPQRNLCALNVPWPLDGPSPAPKRARPEDPAHYRHR